MIIIPEKQEFKNPAVTVDGIIIFDNNGEKEIALIQRKKDPFKDQYALPGGFLEYGKETVEQALVREMKEETNLDVKPKRIVGVYSDPKRDPRGHTVTIAFECEIVGDPKSYVAGDDAKNAKKIPLKEVSNMKLAFDHSVIVKDYIKGAEQLKAEKKTTKSTKKTGCKSK